MKTVSLDAIADDEPLDYLSSAEVLALLALLAAVHSRLASRLVELAQADDYHDDRNQDRLLDAKGAAERLGVATAWLYRHAARLPFTTRVGAHLRFSERELARFIRNRTGNMR